VGDGIPVERELVQWLTRNYVHSLSSDDEEKKMLAEYAAKFNGSLKVEVAPNGDIDWGIKF
jgi:hypothetical protein